MVEVHSAWFQPDSQDTRERMQVETGSETGLVVMSKLEHNGPITTLEYGTNVIGPALERTWALGALTTEQAYYYEAKKWFNTLSTGGLPGVEQSYEAALQAVGGASHLQDPWPGDMVTALETEINAQVLAGTHPGVPAGLLAWSIEWDYSDGYFGTVGERELDIATAVLFQERYNRAGTLIPGGATFDGLAVVAIGRDMSYVLTQDIDYADPPVFYSATGPTNDPPDVWSSTGLTARTNAEAPHSISGDGSGKLVTIGESNTATVPISDAWWDANKWTITRFGSDTGYGVPLLLSPEWLADNGPLDPYPTEDHTRGAYAATIYMNAVWTPPPYRIIYDVDSTAIPPRRIFGRSDGATHGARRALGGGNTRQSGSRTLGSIL